MSEHSHDPNTPDPVGQVDAEEVELHVTDPDDYHETQRLREIHDARKEVRTTLRELDRYATPEEHHKQKLSLCDAVAFYIAELEELIHATGHDDSLEGTPWDSLRQYTTMMGANPETNEPASYEASIFIFRQANNFLAEAKPLVTEQDENEWTV
jgi:hypothetical protein